MASKPAGKSSHPYTRDGALGFPLMPSEHDRAWRYLFDWAIAGDALNCAPGDLVMEFGAGPGFASELFNRLGYRTVAIDLDPTILGYARERWALDRRLDARRAAFVVADGLHLPFADASFDGIVCLNALHHMPDYRQVLAEMRRVLRPGARAAFSEPGSLHERTHEAVLAREQGALERSVHLDEIAHLAREVGFQRVILKPYVYPYLVELDYGDFRRYRLHATRVPFTQPHQVARFVVEHHPLFVLEAPGRRPPTSANPRGFGALRADIAVDGLPSAAEPAQPIGVRVRLTNSGHCIWLAGPREFGGDVRFGAKLCRPGGGVLDDRLGRTPLPHAVAPGQSVELDVALVLPWVEPGPYRLKFDLVSEQVAWFEFFGSPPALAELTVRCPTSRAPHVLRAALAVHDLPARATAGATVRATVRATNRGDTVWLAAPIVDGGHVTLGVKLLDPAGMVLSDALGRTPLPVNVAPDETVTLSCAVPLPSDLPAGTYRLRFDMVHELIEWFGAYSSPVSEHALAIDPLPVP